MDAVFDDIDIHQFMELLKQRGNPPVSAKARYQLLATELAEGMSYGFWEAHIEMPNHKRTLGQDLPFEQRNFIEHYFIERWNARPPDFSFLLISGYLVPSNREGYFTVTKAALDLLDKQISSRIKVFISYRRAESSAFALLIHDRLKEAGVDVFLDMESLVAGENWRLALENSIRERDYFILLIGRTTLLSTIVKQEIAWAYEHDLHIIPIWHNGFRYDPKPEHKIPPDMKTLLSDTHTLVIEQENPAQYDYAMQRLFRYFNVG